MVKVGIIGVTGFSGEELLRILLKHAHASVVSVSAKIDAEMPLDEIYSDLKTKLGLTCAEPDIDEISKKCDVIFLALPHTVSMKIAPLLLKKGKLVIDLSADYRLDAPTYETHYKVKHLDLDNLGKAVYGLPEINRDLIKKTKLIANPGCYPTAALLGILPLLKAAISVDSIYIDAKSGISGAGRKPELKLDEFKEKGNLKAYKVNSHQHAPEILQQINKLTKSRPELVFVPHLIPAQRGILETIYIRCKIQKAESAITGLYKKFYKHEPFVRVLDDGVFPQLQNVVNTNFCEIGLKVEDDLLIVVSAIDNLVKGASGQAIQNMNIACRFKETEGLL
ncbi:MAG: N-acetyl-gamma-glutamyl-phosphate reductase [Candidatus Omnitrophica bacterium]|nr:N-acetyl-gamma-glutamyl-phosphate reductase [Candidatus Omnitrophota bacterium]